MSFRFPGNRPFELFRLHNRLLGSPTPFVPRRGTGPKSGEAENSSFLHPAPPTTGDGKSRDRPVSHLNQIRIDDRTGTGKPSFGKGDCLPRPPFHGFELPPAPPGQLFDARFSSGSMGFNFCPIPRARFSCEFNPNPYPISRVEPLPGRKVRAISFGGRQLGRRACSGPLRNGGERSMSANRRRLARRPSSVSAPLPKTISLKQNIPILQPDHLHRIRTARGCECSLDSLQSYRSTGFRCSADHQKFRWGRPQPPF